MSLEKIFPKIYSFVKCPVIGELGEKTKIISPNTKNKCQVCGRNEKKKMKFLDYRLDKWSGEEIIQVIKYYAVSKNLRLNMEKLKIKGVKFRDMKISKAEYFDEATKPGVKVPKFYNLEILAMVDGPSVWFINHGKCSSCSRYDLEMTEAYINGQFEDGANGEILPRKVSKSSWQGDDFFQHLADPGAPLVTQRVVDLFQTMKVKDVGFSPAEWVD